MLRDDLELDAFERDYYSALYLQSRAKFGAYAEAGVLMSNYANLFELLTRLRQAVDHPYLVVHGNHANKTVSPRLSPTAFSDGTHGHQLHRATSRHAVPCCRSL